MRFLEVMLLGTAGLWGQAAPPNADAPPSARLADTLVPASEAASVAAGSAACPDIPNPLELAEPPSRRAHIWGLVGARAFFAGDRVAPNGHVFDPLFSLGNSFNLGILPDQKLYLFFDTTFWGQKPDAEGGITNSRQGIFDFSKREFDLTIGFAWNYVGPWEFRVFGYADNNLNRGHSPTQPRNFSDGVALENRYYFATADKYDLPRRRFVSLGYYPTKTMIGGDGEQFHPGFFGRAYYTWDLPWLQSYLYADGQLLCEQVIEARMLTIDAGLAVRPFVGLPALELRLGLSESYDVQANVSHWLGYGAFQVIF
jgi:hypothetical protein